MLIITLLNLIIYDNLSEVLKITITEKDTGNNYVRCMGTIKNNSNHTFKYLKLEAKFLSLNGILFLHEDYEIRNLEPNESENFIFTND